MARARPARPSAGLDAPESAVFSEEQVDENTFRSWLRNNDLALIVTRNQTTRDRADQQAGSLARIAESVEVVALMLP